MNYSVEPELLGGMIIRINDRVVDSSIKTKLDKLAGDLKKIQLS
jgi:F-type H+-transporting ATPase subunit delta